MLVSVCQLDLSAPIFAMNLPHQLVLLVILSVTQAQLEVVGTGIIAWLLGKDSIVYFLLHIEFQHS